MTRILSLDQGTTSSRGVVFDTGMQSNHERLTLRPSRSGANRPPQAEMADPDPQNTKTVHASRKSGPDPVADHCEFRTRTHR